MRTHATQEDAIAEEIVYPIEHAGFDPEAFDIAGIADAVLDQSGTALAVDAEEFWEHVRHHRRP
ncbi:MAG: hypothetical protein ACTH0V_05200 [Microbacteriaceae bacterium]